MRVSTVLACALLVTTLRGIGSGSAPAIELEQVGAARDAFYPLYATFDLTYEIEWSEREGDPDADCSSWRVDRGTTTVVARDAPWKRKRTRRPRKYGIPGSTDCGERRFTTRNAVVAPQVRKRLKTLDDHITVGFPGGSGRILWEVLAISIPSPRQALYRTCRTSAHAYELPSNVAVRVKAHNLLDLKDLEPGRQSARTGGRSATAATTFRTVPRARSRSTQRSRSVDGDRGHRFRRPTSGCDC